MTTQVMIWLAKIKLKNKKKKPKNPYRTPEVGAFAKGRGNRGRLCKGGGI